MSQMRQNDMEFIYLFNVREHRQQNKTPDRQNDCTSEAHQNIQTYKHKNNHEHTSCLDQPRARKASRYE